jgi:gliding motility-associated-like protein
VRAPIIQALPVIHPTPSAFSPDQNELNEGFKVFNASGNVAFSVYNAWGELLYTTTNNTAWNGTYKDEPCQQGVYLYVADIKGKDNEMLQFKGTVTLLK